MIDGCVLYLVNVFQGRGLLCFAAHGIIWNRGYSVLDCFYSSPCLSLPFPHPKLPHITIPCFLLLLYDPDNPLNTFPSSLSMMSMSSADVSPS